MKPRNLNLYAVACLSLLGAGLVCAQAPARNRKAKAAPVEPPAAASAAPVEKAAPAPPADDAAASETEILAMQGATFSSKERVATFVGDVRVTDPRFQIACDELTVYLKKTSAPKPAAGAAPTPTPPPAPNTGEDSQNAMGGGIDHAVAKGHVIIVQERAATDGGAPKRSVGRGERADFDNNTGDMVLHGLPSVEQNGNTHVATSPGTVMTLRRDNSLSTKGPSRTLIKQEKDDSKPGKEAAGRPQG